MIAASQGRRPRLLQQPEQPDGDGPRREDGHRLRRRASAQSSPDTVILIDEAYHEYVTDPSYQSAVPLALDTPNVFVRGRSRRRTAWPACAIGYAIGRAETMKPLAQLKMPYNISVFGVAAAIAALGDHDAHRRGARAQHRGARVHASRRSPIWDASRPIRRATSSSSTSGRPAKDFRDACAKQGVVIGRDFPPFEKTHVADLDRDDGRDAEGDRGVPKRAAAGIDVNRRADPGGIMALTRRGFVRTVGIGAAGALTSFVDRRARPREQPLVRCSSQRCTRSSRASSSWPATRTRSDPARRCSTRCRPRSGDGGRAPGRYSGSVARSHRRDREETRRQAGERRARLRLDADPPIGDAPVHGEGQAARRHDPDLRGVRRLRGDDGPPGARRRARRRRSRSISTSSRTPSKGAGLVFYCNPNNPTATYVGARATREFLARVNRESPDTTILVDEAYFDYVTDPDHDTHIPIAVENPRVIVARTFSKAYGMAGLRIGYAVGHTDTIKKMADWDGGIRHRLAERPRDARRARGDPAGPSVHRQRARAQQGRARLHDEVVRRSRHEADRLAGQLHVRQHRPARRRSSATPAARRASSSRATSRRSRRRTAASRSGRWRRCRRRWRCSARCSQEVRGRVVSRLDAGRYDGRLRAGLTLLPYFGQTVPWSIFVTGASPL